MKLVINGQTVEVRGSASIAFDTDRDELIIDSQGRRVHAIAARKPVLMLEGPEKVQPSKPPKKVATSKAKLEADILEYIGARSEPAYAIGLSKALLGIPAGKERLKYFKLLLSEMVTKGQLVQSTVGKYTRYTLGQAENG